MFVTLFGTLWFSICVSSVSIVAVLSSNDSLIKDSSSCNAFAKLSSIISFFFFSITCFSYISDANCSDITSDKDAVSIGASILPQAILGAITLFAVSADTLQMSLLDSTLAAIVSQN